ncbi:MAG: serine--tRNA ligase [Cyclobacteriaceae bacterium]
MLQVATIKAQFDKSVEALKKRGIQNGSELLNDIVDIDEKRKSVQQSLDEVLTVSNQIAKKIGGLMKEGKKEEAEIAKKETAELKQKSKELSEELTKLSGELQTQLYNIPNIPHESVPAGKSEEDNEVIKTVDANIPDLYEGAKPHWDLIEEYNIIDFELGNKITGAGFPVYKREGARLVRAMINYFLDQAIEAGFEEVQPPILINEDSGYGTGQLPDKEGQMYQAEGTNLFLIPTAEVPITNLYRDVILTEDQLPIKHVGFTPCFRKEAGSWGAHVRGLNRLHQFDKVEIVQITKSDDSYKTLDEMVNHVEKLVASLGLPYRILRLCGGDLGFTSALTFDFEVYSAAQKKWLEVSSVSNFEAYQSNRLKLRIKNKEGKKELANTLNGSALAIPRILAAILENNQTENEIFIPEVLHAYTGFKSITKK